MKAHILNLLRARNGIVSGTYLGSQLGISRVSIWKHIQTLRDSGYTIRSCATGYQLRHSPDTPFPWEFLGRETAIYYFAEVDSTMTVARELARNGCPHFTVVVADRQHKGRGRLDRRWVSQAGGLYFTLVLRPRLPVVQCPRVSFLAALTLVRVLEDMYAIDAKVKWPNDVLIGEHKLAGILVEMEAEVDHVHYMNLGIGINVNNSPRGAELRATSLKLELGRKTSRKALLKRFLDEFENLLEHADFAEVVSWWKASTVTLNRPVRIVTNQDACEGFAVDIDDNGALLVRMADGSLQKILCGDCFHLNQRL